MRKVSFTLCFLLILFTQAGYTQNAPIATAGNIINYGSTAIVPISVENFNAIGSCNLKFLYDPSILVASVVTKEAVLPGNLASNLTVPGIISLGWYTVPGATLPDNTVIFNLVFAQIAPGYSEITWDDNGYSCSWSDENFNYLNDTPTADFYLDGSVDGNRYIELDVLLEGPFQTSEMTTVLNTTNLLPLSQPYSGAPWNYSGTESVGAIPNENVVDWCLIEIRDALDASSAASATAIQKEAAFLLKDGSVVGLDGNSNIALKQFIQDEMFAVVWHRNHLGVMSASALTFNAGLYSFNFTTSASQAYLGGQIDLGGGYFGMYAGDADGNGDVNQDDINLRWALEAGNSGYYGGDMNMDSQVNNQDKDDVCYPNLNQQTLVPD